MHTTETQNSLTWLHDGDPGPTSIVKVAIPSMETEPDQANDVVWVNIPFADIVELVAHLIRNKAISALEEVDFSDTQAAFAFLTGS